jgi:hypothetical protein
MKPGSLSQELKEALGMPEGAPPPWLINMQVRLTISVFGSVVAGAFQKTFRAKMHANDVFSFFKNHF